MRKVYLIALVFISKLLFEKTVLTVNIIIILQIYNYFFQHIDSVMEKIERGYRMEIPDGCPQKVYDVMRDCWEMSPDQRPSFKKIFATLDHIYGSFLAGN